MKNSDPAEFDFLIIGQGIAGTLLSFHALQRNKRVLVVDNNHLKSASLISSGVINPVTGRRIVKSWMIEELMEKAFQDYTELSELIDKPVIKFSKITRLLGDVEEENIWASKALEESASYLSAEFDADTYSAYFKNYRTAGIISPALIIDMETLLNSWKAYLLERDLLHTGLIQAEDIKISGDKVLYDGKLFKHVIFADGQSGISRSFFDFLKYEDAKGEVLYMKSDEYDVKEMIKSSVNIIPLEGQKYWVGSNYEWEAKDELPTESARKSILNKLNRTAKFSYDIIDQKAAIRACTKDRRPYIGKHPQYPQLILFNGLGTKGISLAPFFAAHLLDHLLYNAPLMDELDFNRTLQ